MGTKITPFNVFIEKFKKRANGEYEYISGYTGMSRKILIKHTICDNEFEVVASAFINTKTSCKKCSDKINAKKRAEIHKLEAFKKNKEIIKEITKNEYELLEYSGYKESKSIFKHNKCGHIFKSKYEFFKARGYRCPKCAKKHTRYTVQELKNNFPVKNVEVIDITYPGPKIKIKCLKCNTIKEIGITTYKNYKFKCCNKIKNEENKRVKEIKAKEYFKNLEIQRELKKKRERYEKQLRNETKFYKYYTEFKAVHGNDIEIKERVYKVTEKFLVKCNICNHEWKANFKKLREGKGCPLCKSSKGEKAINKYLLNNNYSFKKEYSFKNSEIKSLRFDFAVSLNNKIYLIEFDGKQHFNSDAQFGDNNKEEKFNKLVTNDKRKDKYCKDNNIPLLRIPYWEFNNIEKLLSEFLILEE